MVKKWISPVYTKAKKGATMGRLAGWLGAKWRPTLGLARKGAIEVSFLHSQYGAF
jgi:hypothetical protein